MDNSAFVKTFGNTPKVKVLDFFLENDVFDYSKSDVAEQTGISRATLDGFWDSLVKSRIIIESRRIGRAVLYRLNTQLPLVKRLIELDNFLTKQQTDMILKKGKIRLHA